MHISTEVKNSKEYIDAKALVGMLHNGNYEAFLVGGCVRDILLGIQPNDYDITTNAKPEQIISCLRANKVSYYTVGIEYGTIIALYNNCKYEITTYRADGKYVDSRHPENVCFVDTLIKDLERRDFTINAMAYEPMSETLVDELGGYCDLMSSTLHTVGNADDRFKEDALRILRALRFSIKYNLTIDDTVVKSMRDNLNLIDNISKERVTEELKKILTCGKPIKAYFNEYKWLIGKIIPELECCFNFNQNNKYHKHDVYEHILYVVDYCDTDDFTIKLAALLHDIGKPSSYTEDEEGNGHFYGHPDISHDITTEIVSKRLRLTREHSDTLLELVLNHDISIATTEKSVKRALNKYGIDFLNKWFILKQADMDDHIYPVNKEKYYIDIPRIKEIMQEILEKQTCFSLKDLDINGTVLMKVLNLKPCKQIGIILDTLLEEVIDDKLVNEQSKLIIRACELYKDNI